MRWFLYAAIIFLPFFKAAGTVSLGESEVAPYDGFVMLGFLLSLFAFPLVGNKFKLHAIDYIVIIWCLLNILTLLFNANNFFKELNQFRYYVAIPLALYFLTRLYTPTPDLIKKLCVIFVSAISAMSVVGLVEFLQTHQRIVTTAGGAHSGAILFIGGALTALYLISIANKKFYRYLLLCSFGIIVIALVLTMARTLILAAIIIPVVIWYLLSRKQALVKLFFMGLLVVGATLPVIFIGISQDHKLSSEGDVDMNRLTDMKQVESGIGVRVKAYSIALDYISNSPFIGHGGGVYDKMYSDGLELAHAHNLILEILLRIGGLGLCLFVMLVYSLVKIGIAGYIHSPKGERELFTLFLSLIAIVLANGFTNNIANLISNSALWLYFAILVSAASFWMGSYKEDKVEKNKESQIDDKYRGVRLRN